MDFGFTEEQEKFRQEVRDFCATTPKGEIADPRETLPFFSPSFYDKVIEKGWIGLAFPKDYGGLGLDLIHQTIFYEEMNYCFAPISIQAHGLSMSQSGYILKFGTERQKKKYLPQLTKGEITWISQALTEPNAGADLSAIQTRAVRKGDDYVISGQKMFCSLAHTKNSLMILMARTDPDAPLEKGISLFIVPTGLPGMTVRELRTIGQLATNELFLDDVRVPKEDLLGEEEGLNRGFDYYRECQYLEWEKAPGSYVASLGQVFNALVKYIRETKIDGLPMGQDPSVRRKIAELATDIEILRLLGYKQVWAQSKDLDILRATAIQAVYKDELMVKLPHLATQILGLYGQLNGSSRHAVMEGMVEALYRTTALYLFANCGALTRKNFIATQVLGLPESHGY